MGAISGLLVTVRSAKQGAEMMANKLSAEYGREISALRIHADDMYQLSVSEGHPVRIASPYGEAIVTCQPADVPRGTFFLPLGPVANRLFSGAHTEGTGVPDWKRQSVTIEPVESLPPNPSNIARMSDDATETVPEKSSAANIGSTVVHSNVVCTFCGCLCDDLEVEVHGNRVNKVKKACLIGRNKFMHAQSNNPAPSIAGREVSIEETVAEAARILRESKFPLVYGLSSATTEAQRVLVEITELLGGTIDNPSSYCHGPGVMARQQVGLATCTLGEVKNRADLVIFWGCNPLESHMRHLNRYSSQPKGLFTPEGRKGRRIVAIDVRPTPTTKAADQFIQVKPGTTFETATLLRALVRGLRLGIKEDAEVAGVPLSIWRELADAIKGCQYGVIFFGLGVTQCRGRDLNPEQLSVLVREVNDYTRFFAIPMRGHGNVAGCNQVMCWQTGYPLAVNFSRRYPRYNPGEFSVLGHLARKEVDAALIVATDPGAHLPQDSVAYLREIPTIYLEPHNNTTTGWANVVIPVAPAGVGAAGTFYRMDNIPLRARKLVDFPYPSDEQVLRAIQEKIRHA
jgi:formylmethanofuran dehydrogenase subunit B